MANPLFNALGGGKLPGPMGQMQNLVQQFQQFRDNFRGDPRAEVQRLLDSGKMTQQQYNQLQGIARQMMHMMGGNM